MQRYLLIYMKDEDGNEEISISSYHTLQELIADNPEAIGKDEVHQDAWLEEGYCIVDLNCGITGVVAEEIDQLNLEAVIFPQEDEEEE